MSSVGKIENIQHFDPYILVNSAVLPVVENGGSHVEAPPSIDDTRGAIFTSNSDNEDTVLHELDQLNAHKFVGLDLDVRVNKTEKEIKLKDCIDYLERFGYLVGDYRGLKDESLKMYIAPALRIFQSNMKIPLTGEKLSKINHLKSLMNKFS